MGATLGHRTSGKSVLAAVGKLASNRVIDRAHREASGLFDSSGRIRYHASGELLPSAAHFDHRHIQSREATAAERQRSALETLIANVEPAKAAAIASALIDEFSSIGRVFAETREAIERVVGQDSNIAGLLQAAHQACVAGLAGEIQLRAIHSTDQALIDYLIASMGSEPVERLRVLFLNRSNHLIGDEVLVSGSPGGMAVYPRNIFKRSLELSASGLLLVHNHPGGNIEPSKADIAFTREMKKLALTLEIDIHDHIIITGTRWFSLAKWGLL
jgi:DNA repair protein RadC